MLQCYYKFRLVKLRERVITTVANEVSYADGYDRKMTEVERMRGIGFQVETIISDEGKLFLLLPSDYEEEELLEKG